MLLALALSLPEKLFKFIGRVIRSEAV